MTHRHAPMARGLRRLIAPALLFAVAVLAGPARVDAQGADPGGRAARAEAHIRAMDLDAARAELARADASLPLVTLAKARLAVYEEDCDLAAATMAAAPLEGDDARIVADVARGCARVTAATVVSRDEASGVIVRFQDEGDRALAPLFVETVVKARSSLERDLGAKWKGPTRITVVRDLLSLSAMTGLPYKAAQTTGTVAVAKWGRVTILSPRASKHGYPWRDTLVHELTHLAISMQSEEQAPLWLHEGVARRQEHRWRAPGPFDERPSPEAIVQRGAELGIDYPLDKLGPSIAMLPSADAAMVAFAEVTSFVKYFVESSPEGTLARFLVALRTAPNADDALAQVSGRALSAWDTEWRKALAKHPREPLSPMFGLGAPPKGLGESRERSRLAELLFGRGHAAEALRQLDEIPAPLFADPSLRYARARALEATGDTAGALALLADTSAWLTSFGPCWAALARLGGDPAASVEAHAHDPLAVETACGQLTPPDAPSALCAAAIQRNEPDFGKD